MPSGTWAYSTGDDLDQCPRGVYREATDGESWVRMAPLPYVLERLIRRDNGSKREATYYRLAMSLTPDAGDVVICDEEDVRTGAWAGRLDVALGAAPQIVQAAASAIFDTAREHAESRELTPRVHRGFLELPPADVGPAGYGLTADGEAHARDAWHELLTLCRELPRLALTIGAALGGIYVAPLKRQSFFFFLAGDGGKGKTTALNAAASVVGDSTKVMKSWSSTPIAVLQELAMLGLLPAFRDELGAGGFRPRDLEKLIFTITQGGNRSTGGKTGIPRTGAPWHGVLLSTGNDSITGQLTNEGAIRRVIELDTPITRDKHDAERIDTLSAVGFGWPLRWLQQAGLDVDGFALLLDAVERDMPLPDESVPLSIARHLALAVAGIERLEQMAGTTGARDAALTEARELLATQIAELRESGMTPGQRVLAAVRETLASRPSAFPTRKAYEDSLSSAYGSSRDTEGWDVSGEVRQPGDLAVLTGKLETICQAAGITNAMTGLRQLSKDGILIRPPDVEGRLRRQIRVAGRRHDVYQFRLDTDDEVPGDSAVSTEPSNAATPQNRNDGNTPAEEQVTPTLTAPDADVLVYGEAGPVRMDGRAPAPCRVCGKPSPLGTDDLGPVHAMCAMGQQPPPPAESAPERPAAVTPTKDTAPTATRRQRSAQRSRQRLVPCGVLADDGLWLPNAEAPIQVQPPADVAAAYRIAAANELRQLWVHPSAHAALGIPATREMGPDVGPATPVPHEWAAAGDGLRVDAGGAPGLSSWVNVAPSTGDGRRIGISFPAYDHTRTEWHKASTGRALLDAVLRFTATTGDSFYMSPNETTAAIVRRTAGEKLTAWPKPKKLPTPVGKVHHLDDWSRALTDEEDTHRWVHSYDLNGAELGAQGALLIGVGTPDLVDLETFDREQWKKRAGYVLADVPRRHATLDPRLPNIVEPWTRHDERHPDNPGGPVWVPAETLVLLDELGVPIETSKALVWSESARLLRTYQERMSKARLELVTADSADEAAALALAVIKGSYKSRIGDYNRAGARIYRPDIRDMIKAKARANGYRALRRIAAASGRYPIAWHVDAALYTSDSDDPAEAKPSGMVFGPALGQWKPEADKTIQLAKIREVLGERAFTAKVERIRKGR